MCVCMCSVAQDNTVLGNLMFSVAGICRVIHILWVSSTKRGVDARDVGVILTSLLLMTHKINHSCKCSL